MDGRLGFPDSLPITATENPRPFEQLYVGWGPEFWLLEP